jgi:protein SCO1/2
VRLSVFLLSMLVVTPSFAQGGRAMETDPPKPIIDFALTDQDGKSFRLSQLRGAPALVFFGFVNCPDVCPMILGRLKSVRAARDPALASLAMVMISVDGKRDTPAEMKRYVGAGTDGFIGLTGDPRRVRDIAAQFSAVFFQGMPAGADGRYNVDHTTQVYVIDRQGRLRSTLFDASVEELTAAAKRVAQE